MLRTPLAQRQIPPNPFCYYERSGESWDASLSRRSSPRGSTQSESLVRSEVPVMAAQNSDQFASALFDLITGHRVTAVIYVAAQLGICDLLAESPKERYGAGAVD